jgi:hypothetical protein
MKPYRVPLLLAGIALLLLWVQVPASACSTSCSDGSYCDTNIAGGVCTCSCGSACCGRACPLCEGSTAEEIATFKARVDEWASSDRAEVRALADAAANLYTAVLLKDHQGYLKARDQFNEQIRLLSPADRMEVNTDRKR